jgi:hypothetical protein
MVFVMCLYYSLNMNEMSWKIHTMLATTLAETLKFSEIPQINSERPEKYERCSQVFQAVNHRINDVNNYSATRSCSIKKFISRQWIIKSVQVDAIISIRWYTKAVIYSVNSNQLFQHDEMINLRYACYVT